MWHPSTILLAIILSSAALLAGYIFLFGIPPSLKRWLEEEVLEKMGENKASYMAKSAVDKLPAADQDEIKGLRSGVKDIMGEGLQNPLGKFAGNLGDDATKPATGR
ncbi:hypothetical protein BDY17DRAFT_298161 [Neohortaea acidophila]|uniref:Uncharacterized protein n=1 Tax=Neohortaea acidophila TaxID=245834 RepID=A0A6A6PQD8_9PEZI|nr:uncharacterized protein BDY17DRAFT_298161 [Neohortaea acidophila]KAF2482222.1 hypothetical protein BDY17DRAFT_298161 [Neohortaea acidophila]